MQTWREGPGEHQGEASLGRRTLLPEERRRVALRDKPPGQGHWPTSRAEAACHVLGPAGVRAAGQRLQSVTAPVSRDGTAASGTLPFTDVLLPRMRTGKGLHREKHEPVFAGWIPQLQFGGKGAEDHRSLAHTC